MDAAPVEAATIAALTDEVSALKSRLALVNLPAPELLAVYSETAAERDYWRARAERAEAELNRYPISEPKWGEEGEVHYRDGSVYWRDSDGDESRMEDRT